MNTKPKILYRNKRVTAKKRKDASPHNRDMILLLWIGMISLTFWTITIVTFSSLPISADNNNNPPIIISNKSILSDNDYFHKKQTESNIPQEQQQNNNFEDSEWSAHRNAIKEAFIAAYSAYDSECHGYDELFPNGRHSRKCRNWVGLGLTLIDSLDSMIIFQLNDLYHKSYKEWIETNLNFNVCLFSYPL